MYTAMCEKDSSWEAAIQHRELSSVLCDDLEGGMGVGWRLKREGICVCLWLIRVVVQQKPTQHCKAIILQFQKK